MLTPEFDVMASISMRNRLPVKLNRAVDVSALAAASSCKVTDESVDGVEVEEGFCHAYSPKIPYPALKLSMNS